jgi:hypothetical protein
MPRLKAGFRSGSPAILLPAGISVQQKALYRICRLTAGSRLPTGQAFS